MENITPTLILLWDIKRSLEKGLSVRNGVETFLRRNIKHAFLKDVEIWWQSCIDGAYNIPQTNPSKKYLLEIASYGLKGQPILEIIKSYEKELVLRCEDEISEHIAKLPLFLMIPLMGLIFPALMLLLIWPTLQSMQL